jgi:uncharacterized protein (TIGR00369 family)
MARELLEAQPFLRLLGAQVTELAPGRCELRLAFRPELAQHDGGFHGGLLATLADVAGGAAGHTLLPADRTALTVEFKVNIMAPGRGEALVARGQVVRTGRTLTVCRVDVAAVSGETETPCAACLMTLMAVPR